MSPRKDCVVELRRRLDDYKATISQSFLVDIKVDSGAVRNELGIIKGDVNLIKISAVELSAAVRTGQALVRAHGLPSPYPSWPFR